jgi:beta-glucanase (GH16 family)
MLVIECRKERFKPARHAPVAYTSASLMTRGKTNFEYGRIEMRAKIPRGKGVWPAFWTVGADRTHVDWPFCGEIDIMEFVGRDPDHIYGTIHFALDGKHAKDGGKIETDRPFDDFHIYAIEWDPERIDFFFDDKKYHTVLLDKAGQGADNPFRRPHYLKLNLALGGDWGGEIDDSVLPQKFLIDYVRVYKRKGGSEK